MNLTEIKKIKKFCDSLDSMPDYRVVVSELTRGCEDFEVDNVRFIADDKIREILEDELCGDSYVLGSFSSWAIADATGWPEFLIKAAQDREQYEAIGEAMMGEHIADLASIYVSNDGYGHHFNRHDGTEEEIKVNGVDYYVFDNR